MDEKMNNLEYKLNNKYNQLSNNIQKAEIGINHNIQNLE
jgi:hypothetical protein